jgi:hypothetical protein
MTDEEMQDYFPTAFPKMFVGKYGGVAVGKGWFNLLRVLCQNIQSHIDWKNKCRQREVDKFNAREQGYDVLLKFYSGGMREPSDYEIEQAQETMKTGVVIPPEVPQVTLDQVKEKFGTLRFYYTGGDDYISGLVSLAESVSGITCEECGDAGEGRNGGWIRTLCDKHEALYQVSKGNYNGD